MFWRDESVTGSAISEKHQRREITITKMMTILTMMKAKLRSVSVKVWRKVMK